MGTNRVLLIKEKSLYDNWTRTSKEGYIIYANFEKQKPFSLWKDNKKVSPFYSSEKWLNKWILKNNIKLTFYV